MLYPMLLYQLIIWFWTIFNWIQSAPCKLDIRTYSSSSISGNLQCHGEDATAIDVHDVQILFEINQTPQTASLSLRSKDNKNVVTFEASNGEIRSTKIYGSTNPQPGTLQKLQNSAEFRVLPALASLLGHNYNVTATDWPISILLYRLAMSSEQRHRTEERADIYLNKKYPSRKKRSLLTDKLVDLENLAGKFVRQLNPWTYDPDDEVLCPSPDGVCDGRIEMKNSSSCSRHGQRLATEDVQSGCMGLCGPSCFRCWSYVCGDCCRHPGCYSHDAKCKDGYLTLECITGKGLVWGDNTETC